MKGFQRALWIGTKSHVCLASRRIDLQAPDETRQTGHLMQRYN